MQLLEIIVVFSNPQNAWLVLKCISYGSRSHDFPLHYLWKRGGGWQYSSFLIILIILVPWWTVKTRPTFSTRGNTNWIYLFPICLNFPNRRCTVLKVLEVNSKSNSRTLRRKGHAYTMVTKSATQQFWKNWNKATVLLSEKEIRYASLCL